MQHPEWSHLKQIKDSENRFSTLYVYPTGESFYIEEPFYTQLQGLKNLFPERYTEVISCIHNVVMINKKVIFTMDFETPVTHKENYIYQEIEDITNELGIYVEDKSRGSDYGD